MRPCFLLPEDRLSAKDDSPRFLGNSPSLGLATRNSVSGCTHRQEYWTAFCVAKYVSVLGLPEQMITNWRQKCVLSQFWRPEAPNQGAVRAVLPPKALGEDPSLPFPACGGSRGSLAGRCIFPFSASVSVSLCVQASLSFLL